jgi:hypothetical protein
MSPLAPSNAKHIQIIHTKNARMPPALSLSRPLTHLPAPIAALPCPLVLPRLAPCCRLVDAFNEYDEFFALSRRQYVPPNFAELRHILNIAQVGGRAGGRPGVSAAQACEELRPRGCLQTVDEARGRSLVLLAASQPAILASQLSSALTRLSPVIAAIPDSPPPPCPHAGAHLCPVPEADHL